MNEILLNLFISSKQIKQDLLLENRGLILKTLIYFVVDVAEPTPRQTPNHNTEGCEV